MDVAANREISTAAEKLLDACVLKATARRDHKRPIGGRLPGVGEYDDIQLFSNHRNYYSP